MHHNLSGTQVNSLLDGKIASDYYNDLNASNYMVNPLDGKRYDNNQIWGSYISSTRVGQKGYPPNREYCVALADCNYWTWTASESCKEYRGSTNVTIGNSRCISYIGAFSIVTIGWH